MISTLPPSSCLTIGDVMTYWHQQQAEHPFLYAPETDAVVSYGELAQEAQHLSTWFDEQGVSARGHVGLFMHNGRQTASVFLATMATGRVVVPMNLLAPVDQLAWVFEHSDIEILFYAPDNKIHLFNALKKNSS